MIRKTVSGRAVAVIGGTVNHPSALEVKVDAKPPAVSQIDYSIDCEKSATHPILGTVDAALTPLTEELPVIPRAPYCFVYISASKSSDTELTLTLLGKGPLLSLATSPP